MSAARISISSPEQPPASQDSVESLVHAARSLDEAETLRDIAKLLPRLWLERFRMGGVALFAHAAPERLTRVSEAGDAVEPEGVLRTLREGVPVGGGGARLLSGEVVAIELGRPRTTHVLAGMPSPSRPALSKSEWERLALFASLTNAAWTRARATEALKEATERTAARHEPSAQKRVGSSARFTFEDLVGSDSAFVACIEAARRVARVDAPVLITGESGTGKELFAQAIHNASPRAREPFVAVNVAAIPHDLLESELFGHERGAFTGAREGGRAGKFEQAGGGTLLLDEIGDMPLEMQVKLLRVLQERILQRLGGTHDVPVRARVIATTHRSLDEAVKAGTFRLDLLHRLRVVHLSLPALRERRGDIRALVEHTLSRIAAKLGRPAIGFADVLMPELERYHWPGNVRELANLLEGEASLLAAGEDVLERLPSSLARATPSTVAGLRAAAGALEHDQDVLPFDAQERRIIEHALARFAGNVARAARALQLSRGTLYNKIRAYDLPHGDYTGTQVPSTRPPFASNASGGP